jgi:D-3-phosphoglycerate dehydrogenase / 2-oxoglutarate reductase
MSQSRIVATGRVLPVVHEILGRFAPIEFASSTDEDSLVAMTKSTIGLIVRGVIPISRRVIEAATDLRVIGRTGVGYDNVDISAATERGIPVVFAPGAGARAVAEGTLMLLLALAKRLLELDRKTRAGEWLARDTMAMGDLYGSVLGVIGLGRIGSEVVHLARAFGMHVIGCDPAVREQATETIGVKLVSLETLLSSADFISLHASLNDKTQGLLDEDRLSLVKHGAILVNVARGGLLASLDVLNEALESGKLSALGLDVYPVEPPNISHPICRRPDVLCTPHCMGLSAKAAQATFVMVSQGMAEVLDGGTPKNVANPEVFSVRPAPPQRG